MDSISLYIFQIIWVGHGYTLVRYKCLGFEEGGRGKKEERTKGKRRKGKERMRKMEGKKEGSKGEGRRGKEG